MIFNSSAGICITANEPLPSFVSIQSSRYNVTMSIYHSDAIAPMKVPSAIDKTANVEYSMSA